MYPHERSLVKRYQNRPFVILGVNSDRDREMVSKVKKELNLSWRSWFDGGSTDGPIATRWNVEAWPTLYLIDHEGVIRHKEIGDEQLDDAIEALVLEAEKDAKQGD